ncbi:uncharacterized protein LOC110431173 [Sorghum bicolor]|uniref:uncharacterized protein LOC110431173 n=1 Tax=Sorghum bicolor TaxID=4558 RepID=UPI000B42585D|nr:uncharacterized protein LOC110431173 [Sorghum bicolor]|eukprot:XP_021305565.1 uncharacterized protein LOC110431173 [Sorghum bicolor]
MRSQTLRLLLADCTQCSAAGAVRNTKKNKVLADRQKKGLSCKSSRMAASSFLILAGLFISCRWAPVALQPWTLPNHSLKFQLGRAQRSAWVGLSLRRDIAGRRFTVCPPHRTPPPPPPPPRRRLARPSDRAHGRPPSPPTAAAADERVRRRNRDEPALQDPAALSLREVDVAKRPSKKPCHAASKTYTSSIVSSPNIWADLLECLLHQIMALLSSSSDILASFPSTLSFSHLSACIHTSIILIVVTAASSTVFSTTARGSSLILERDPPPVAVCHPTTI